MRNPYQLTVAIVIVLATCAQAQLQPTVPQPTLNAPHPNLPGAQPDGSVLLPNQWSLHPTGRQVELGDFPVNIAVHPKGRFAAVLHSGYSTHEIIVVDLQQAKAVLRTNLHETFYGLEFSMDGTQLFCSGASDEVIHRFDFRNGLLTNHVQLRLRPSNQRGVPAGLAVDSSAQRLWAADLRGDRVSRLDLVPQTRVSDFPLEANAQPLKREPQENPTDLDTAAANKRAEAALEEAKSDETFPYACRLDEKRRRLYVSLWAQSAVAVLDSDTGKVLARWPTEEHPCEMVLSRAGKFLFVANSARNSVTVFDTATGKAIETICAALYPQSPPGSTPNSLALSPDEKTLFIANADNNSVAVFDVSVPGKSRSLGFIPVGWYPTSVRVTPDGKHLLVANGKGLSSAPNPHGPQPGVNDSAANPTVQYIARLFRGSLSIIDLPLRKKFEEQLADYTAQAYRCTPLKADFSVTALPPANSPIPAAVAPAASNGSAAVRSPIKYVLYIIKENRTYDQVLGDMPQGNGDPKLCLFPERVTPNHHQLANQFVLLDNFYVDAEVSADGHEWSMGAYATDFVEKTWPLNYGHGASKKFPYPSEGLMPVAYPASGYIWDRARAAGVSYRSYGEFVTDQVPAKSRVASLQGHIDEAYRGFNLDYSDTNRAARFISELKRFEAEGDMPRLQILRLGNDHTHGSTRGHLSPTAYLGDNDLALGEIIDAVSHSKFWPQTAVFVLEDDAQNGPDHVDAHRSIAFILSPYAKHGVTDSTMYSTSSMLRTMELILGLQPMSQYDTAATPMFNAFQAQPELSSYDVLPANVDLKERNRLFGWGSELKLDFDKEDAVDDLVLNEAIWREVRGDDQPMPAPVRAAFIRQRSTDDD
jgi:YVTN family beta-propeller protein